jgi:hypothetical protein
MRFGAVEATARKLAVAAPSFVRERRGVLVYFGVFFAIRGLSILSPILDKRLLLASL